MPQPPAPVVPPPSPAVSASAVPLLRAVDAEKAIRLANDTRYGLGSNVWTSDLERAQELALRLDAGQTAINSITASDPRLPFGGIKDSTTAASSRPTASTSSSTPTPSSSASPEGQTRDNRRSSGREPVIHKPSRTVGLARLGLTGALMSTTTNQYATGNTRQRIESALREAGKGLGNLIADDLVPLGRFHTLGPPATRELAELADAHQQPSLTAKKLRTLELKAGAPRHTKAAAGIFSVNRAMRAAEKQLAEQAEVSYKRMVQDQQAGAPVKKWARARHRSAHKLSPRRAKPRGRLKAPDVCASLRQSPAPTNKL